MCFGSDFQFASFLYYRRRREIFLHRRWQSNVCEGVRANYILTGYFLGLFIEIETESKGLSVDSHLCEVCLNNWFKVSRENSDVFVILKVSFFDL